MKHQPSTYSQIAAYTPQQSNPFRYDRQVEIHLKFNKPMKRFEIYEELQKLKCPFQTKISSIIQLPGLRATIYAIDRPLAIQINEILMKSTVIEEIKRYGEDETKIVLNWVPPQFLNNDILKIIDAYAKPIRINHILDQYWIQTDTKHVFVKKEGMRHIPRFLQMGAVQVHVRYWERPAFWSIVKRVVMKGTNVNTSMMSETVAKKRKQTELWRTNFQWER